MKNDILNSDNSNSNVSKFEKCVVCGKITDILKETPIEIRKNYVRGCGQLCDDCYEKMK